MPVSLLSAYLPVLHKTSQLRTLSNMELLHFTNAVIAIFFNQLDASSSASWSLVSPPSNFVNGHTSTMWFVVCWWLQSQMSDVTRPHLCKQAQPVQKWFSSVHIWQSRLKLDCQIVGSHTRCWLITEADMELLYCFCTLSFYDIILELNSISNVKALIWKCEAVHWLLWM